MKGVRIALVLGLAVVALGGAQGARGAVERPETPTARDVPVKFDLPGTTFTSLCDFSHRNSDDLIVFPGRPGLSHNHTYVGNTSTNARSTVASLRQADTTCQRDADTASYWVPTLFDSKGNAIEPAKAVIYYRRETIKPVVAFPPGLRMIAGDSMAMRPQAGAAYWDCGFQGSHSRSAGIPNCPPGRQTALRLHVTFPNCWNGRDLDSGDHKSHMALAVEGICPSSHPVAVPTIALTMRYPVHGEDKGLALASGGQYSGHADFVNSWDQDELVRLVGHCLNALRHCGRGG